MLLVVDRGSASPSADDKPRPPHGGERAVGQRWHKLGGSETRQLCCVNDTALAVKHIFGSSGTVDTGDGALEAIMLASGSVGGGGPASLLLAWVALCGDEKVEGRSWSWGAGDLFWYK